jgi:hypothetical protein
VSSCLILQTSQTISTGSDSTIATNKPMGNLYYNSLRSARGTLTLKQLTKNQLKDLMLDVNLVTSL